MSEEFWDDKFDVDGLRYGEQPNAFVEAQANAVIAPGARVICLGAGEGRNPIWLAQQGFEVSALDQSGVGLKKLRERAASAGVEVTTIKSSIEEWTPEPDSFAAVVMTYFHLPAEVRQQTHRKVVDALNEGGVVIIEAFTPRQIELERTSGGPPAIALMYTAEMLAEDFSALTVEHMTEETVELSEGPGHTGPGEVVRMVARNPNPSGGSNE
jgi:2-polyprenyl-3-methyl-5-hydroxy-6-metoxy-1,4-benzoquinol methylase